MKVPRTNPALVRNIFQDTGLGDRGISEVAELREVVGRGGGEGGIEDCGSWGGRGVDVGTVVE